MCVLSRSRERQVQSSDWLVVRFMQVMWLPGIPLPISVIICHDKRCA